jgi:phospholipid/cholesterol/gamma-HCH transport system substrate-binding protein
MARRTVNFLKLGVFVLAGLAMLIVGLYLLGKNQSLFNPRFPIQVHFRDVGGLMPGNNVRLNGIVVGAVTDIQLVGDTLVDVTLSINNAMKGIIRNNVTATIGTDGLIGNRVVELVSERGPAKPITPGERILSREQINTDAMLRTLSETNDNVLQLSLELRETVRHISTSAQLNALLDDITISVELKKTLANLSQASADAARTMRSIQQGVNTALSGQGTVGTLLNDTTLANDLHQTVLQLRSLEQQTAKAVDGIDAFVQSLQQDTRSGGTFQLLMQDTSSANAVQGSLQSIERSTSLLEENLEAMRHSFPFKKYFKKKAKGKLEPE